MCGLVGYLSGNAGHINASELLVKMGQAISHRGPDDSGVWFDAEAGVGMFHRRLSILDLSPAGHQPMVSCDGRYVLVFNGEIYNHLKIREELGAKLQWRGHSDTETLLAGFSVWGIESTVKKAVGMFAVAVWDRQTRTLTLGRDRLGEKPLYYGWQGDTLLFGSELKGLKAHPSFRAQIDRNSLALLMRYNYIPAPYSIYQGIQKLLPGALLTVSLEVRDNQPQRYWDLKKVVVNGLERRFSGSPDDAVEVLEGLLKNSIAGQMLSDVPLGAFLSGGIDSSTIVALMQMQSNSPVRTFTIGFNEEQYNEAGYAKKVARYLGTNHTELYVSSQEAREVIPQLPALYCEPFSDSSQIPTFLVSHLAHQHVKVSLSGDAGDELFCGYNRYAEAQELWRKLSNLPVGLRKVLARGITSLPPHVWDSLFGPIQRLLPEGLAHAKMGDKLHKGAAMMSSQTPAELYRLLVSQWSLTSGLVIGAVEPPTVWTDTAQQPHAEHFIQDIMSVDMLTYLPDDILCKVDRAAMGASLETRVPFLDHRLVEFVWQLPLDYKQHKGISKWLLRQILYKHVPRELIERPKMGFGVPIDVWLRGPLRAWAEELLSESRLRREGYLNPYPVRRQWAMHLSGKNSCQYHLWNVLMFQAWLENNK